MMRSPRHELSVVDDASETSDVVCDSASDELDLGPGFSESAAAIRGKLGRCLATVVKMLREEFVNPAPKHPIG